MISAAFGGISLERGYDSVTLYDGSSTSSSKLGKFADPPLVTLLSSGPALLVVFSSDSSVNSGRFSLDWTAASLDDQGWLVTKHLLTDISDTCNQVSRLGVHKLECDIKNSNNCFQWVFEERKIILYARNHSYLLSETVHTEFWFRKIVFHFCT